MTKKLILEEGKICPLATTVCDILVDRGYEAYIVGGCVRDLILGRNPKDWDICTNAKPEDVITVFSSDIWETVPTGIKHGTVTVVNRQSRYAFEVTTYRIDGEYSDGRHPDNVEFTANLQEDLSRRDFTINAMAMQHTGQSVWELSDPFNGTKDLGAEFIRCVGNPYQRFGEDALRIMRAIRFACQLDFIIEEKTFEALSNCSPGLQNISNERIRDELVKIIMTSDARRGISLMHQTGILKIVLPEIECLWGVEQSKPYHIYDVYDHTMEALGALVSRNYQGDLSTRLAMLCHDTGKLATKSVGEDGICHFYGHPAKSAELTRSFMERLKFDNDRIDEVESLVLYHNSEFKPTRPVVRCLMQNLVRPDIFPELIELKRCDVLAQNPNALGTRLNELDSCLKIYEELVAEGTALKVTDLKVNGNDIMARGYQGKQVGKILRGLLKLVVDEVVENDRDKLLILVDFTGIDWDGDEMYTGGLHSSGIQVAEA